MQDIKVIKREKCLNYRALNPVYFGRILNLCNLPYLLLSCRYLGLSALTEDLQERPGEELPNSLSKLLSILQTVYP